MVVSVSKISESPSNVVFEVSGSNGTGIINLNRDSYSIVHNQGSSYVNNFESLNVVTTGTSSSSISIVREDEVILQRTGVGTNNIILSDTFKNALDNTFDIKITIGNTFSTVKLTFVKNGTSDQFDSGYYWNFKDGLDDWSSPGGVVESTPSGLKFTASNSNTYIRKSVVFPGRFFTIVQAKLKKNTPNTRWEGRLYYYTKDHGRTNTYHAEIPEPDNSDQWNIVTWDMSNLTRGGDDWINNEITMLAIDIDHDANSEYEFEWIRISRKQ